MFRGRNLLVVGGLSLLLVGAGPPGPAHLVKDINTAELPTALSPVFSISTGNGLLFSIGGRLWKTNGSVEGTLPFGAMADVQVGAFLTSYQGIVYFTASSGPYGSELWRTDGTAAGTTMLRDIAPGGASSFASNFVPFQGELFFSASDGSRFELWKTNGTSAGTLRALDVNTRPNGTGLGGMAVLGDRILFVGSSARDPARPNAIYSTDGTLDGTELVADFADGSSPGPCPGACAAWPPSDFVVVGNVLYFIASDGTTGLELWRTDGTPDGTRMVKDICPGACNAFPFSDGLSMVDGLLLQVLNGQLLFFADDGIHGSELWTSDGTLAGTRLVADLNTGSGSSSWGYGMAVSQNVAFFPADDGAHGSQLWRSDGTQAGTFRVPDLNPAQPSGGPDRIVFSGDNVFFVTGRQDQPLSLWRTTAAGLSPTLLSTSVYSLGGVVDLGGTLFFLEVDPSGTSLWRSDGTSAGTAFVGSVTPAEGSSSLPAIVGSIRERLIFGANDGSSWGLWTTDGTAPETGLFSPVGYGANSLQAGGFSTLFRGSLFFSGNDGIHGDELWRTDGTVSGTRMVRDIAIPGGRFGSVDSSNPCGLQVVGDALYFQAFDGDHGLGLWKSDGTEAGTVFVSDVITDCLQRMVPFAGSIYFGAYDQDFRPGLWRTDGTPEGTQRVRDLVASSLTVFGGRLFFVGNDEVQRGVWTTDGSAAGTALFRPGAWILEHTSNLLFFADIDDAGTVTLWSSDGVEASNLVRFDSFYQPAQFAVVGTKLFFVAGESEHGFELWTSDGTRSGTHIVKDIAPGPSDSSPQNLTAIGGVLLFSALDPIHGEELWRSDGTEAGTYLVQDISPGAASSSPANFTTAGSLVFFTADDGQTGTELWAMPISAINPAAGRIQRKSSTVPWRR